MSSSGLPTTGKTWAYWRESSKGPLRWRDWSISAMKKGWESWDCSTWRREASGESYQCVWTPEGRVQRRLSQALLIGIQWWDQRPWAHTKTQEASLEHQELIFLLCEWLSTGTGCSGRWCSLLPWRHSRAVWTWSWAAGSRALRGPAWTGRLDEMTSRGPFQPLPVCDSEHLLKCILIPLRRRDSECKVGEWRWLKMHFLNPELNGGRMGKEGEKMMN